MPPRHPALQYKALRAAFESAPCAPAGEALSALGIDPDRLQWPAKLVRATMSGAADVPPHVDEGASIPTFTDGAPNSIAVLASTDLLLIDIDGSEAIACRWTIPDDDILPSLRRMTGGRRPFPYPAEPPLRIEHTNAGLIEANRTARTSTGGRPPSGFGIVFEVDGGKIVGARHVEQSPVLRPETEIEIEVGGTTRRGMTLVESYGDGPAPKGNLRWAADLFVVDRDTADFVVRAIEEKLQSDHGLAVAMHSPGDA